MRLVDQPAGGGFVYCYDPLNFDQGQHAYPYNLQFWAYDLNEWAAVKAGTKQPWEVKPYGVWPFTLPLPYSVRLGGVAYDSQRQLLYVSQIGAEEGDDGSYRPVIHAFKIR
jgi:hypothetical protein